MLVCVFIKDAGDLKPFLSDTSVFIIDLPAKEQLFCILLMICHAKQVRYQQDDQCTGR